MNKRTKILITLDGSEHGNAVLPTVRALFKPAETELILLQVIVPMTYATYPTLPGAPITWDPQMIEHDWIEQRKYVVHEMNHIAHSLEAEGYSVRVHIPLGDPISEITRFVAEEGAELIAMATHGRTGLMRLLLGSVAEGTMRQVHVPVLLVRPTEQKDARSPVVDKEEFYESPSI